MMVFALHCIIFHYFIRVVQNFLLILLQAETKAGILAQRLRYATRLDFRPDFRPDFRLGEPWDTMLASKLGFEPWDWNLGLWIGILVWRLEFCPPGLEGGGWSRRGRRRRRVWNFPTCKSVGHWSVRGCCPKTRTTLLVADSWAGAETCYGLTAGTTKECLSESCVRD